MKTIEERATDTLNRRIQGSFGYRAADSILQGFDASENILVFKAHGGSKEGLEGSLDLAIERAKPDVSVKDVVDNLGLDAGEAKEFLDEEEVAYKDMQENRGQYLKQLHNAFDKAPDSYTHLSTYTVENFQRVADNLVHSARKQYIRTKNADWTNAVQAAVTPLMTEVLKRGKEAS